MTALGRITAETRAAGRSFLRRRTAVFFTFFFPALLVVIFGALITTQPTGGGLFAEPAGYYLPGYLAVVVLFTPLSRLGSEINRTRADSRFEKLATTPLTRREWLLAHTLINVAIIGVACVLILGLVVALTDAPVPSLLALLMLVPFVVCGVTVFCGIGTVLGSLVDSQDGAIAASNTVALPLLFLSETFVPPELLPQWFRPAISASPLTYFARGVRDLTYTGAPWGESFIILAGLAVVALYVGARAVPQTE
ncbi:MAG: ABC-type multidrug transport system, permease component [Halorubrum sp. J07HR59]|nr:MAG: ABC-type multidrug transport system, permease component [Halorubrum sp. J07HR59]